MTLYTIKPGFFAVKFDDDFNVLTTYSVSEEGCSCPAGNKDTCRHREMLQVFKDSDRVGSGWFVDWDKTRWVEPIGVSNE